MQGIHDRFLPPPCTQPPFSPPSSGLYSGVARFASLYPTPKIVKNKNEMKKEGKFSFPIIHCVRAKPNDHRLLNILKQRTEDVDVKKHALEWMKQAVSIAGSDPEKMC